MNSREKGKRGEREFALVCKEHGYDCRRTAQYCGNTGDASDVVGLPGIHIEVKRVERLNIEDAMAQSKHDAIAAGRADMPIVAHRKNEGKWMVTMLADDWFRIYRDWEAGNV